MEKIYLIVLSVLFSCLVGVISYWVKTVHTEFKQILKEVTGYTRELNALIVGIQMQIQKGIETDISDIKENIKTLYNRTNDNREKILSIKAKEGKK